MATKPKVNTTQDKPSPNRRPVPQSVASRAPTQPSAASGWKKATVGGTLVTVPSGNTALVRAPGLQVFLMNGMIPNELMPLVQEAMAKGQAPSQQQIADLQMDPAMIGTVLQLFDDVCVFCTIDPQVSPAPVDQQGQILPFDHPDRDANILYVDEVVMEDKMFIFNFAVGGTSDLTKFREEFVTDVGTLPA